ncbi:hypothetical protein ACH5RR_025123 [Cinchona calisaya]|uniref:Dof zinc finger protein n=1 Tax=Cinchona calisaya TaxID=153742 RepID=A0ABD2YYQ8_9GENT
MQDIHAIGGGGGGRLFAGGSGGGDRRLRPHQNQNHLHHQALKCPRCDSLNTKFCYYNNYNLSQPRHFCKGCRRYWTKGGVLRNVPVGGGCRKTKRSKPKQTVSSDVVAPEKNSNSHSSSESSSLTATTTAAKKTATAGSTGEVASVTETATQPSSNLMNFPDSRFFLPQMNVNENSSFDPNQPLIDPSVASEGQIFTEIGSFTSLMTSSNDQAMLGFPNMTTADIPGYRLQQNHQGSVVDDQSSNQMVGTTIVAGDELKMEQINCGFLDQTAQIGFSGLHQNRISNGGLSSFDWHINGGEPGLFDFTGTGDQAYWGQNQWADNDQSLNFPPLV